MNVVDTAFWKPFLQYVELVIPIRI